MSNIKLAKSGYATIIENSSSESLEVTLLALYEGNFIDMNGTDVEITEDTIKNIASTYNEFVRLKYKEKSKVKDLPPIEEFEEAPNQVDHDMSNLVTAGRVFGLMWSKKIDGKMHLFCKVRVKGAENVARVSDNRWRDVSVQYNPVTYELVEISWVTKGALPEASKFGANYNTNNQNGQTFSTLIAKIRESEQKLTDLKVSLESKLSVKKHLVALCRKNRLSMAKAKLIEDKVHSFNNPKSVIELIESVLPEDKFKAKYVNLSSQQELAKSLIKDNYLRENLMLGEKPMNEKNVQTIRDAFGTISLGKDSKKLSEKDEGIQEQDIDKDNKLSKENMNHYHKKLMDNMTDSYDKGDVEMAKKWKGKLAKFEKDCEEGSVAKLSDYDIEDESKDSKDVKELAAKLEDVNVQLSTLKDSVNTLLSKFADNPQVMLAAPIPAVEDDTDTKKIISMLDQLVKTVENKGE